MIEAAVHVRLPRVLKVTRSVSEGGRFTDVSISDRPRSRCGLLEYRPQLSDVENAQPRSGRRRFERQSQGGWKVGLQQLAKEFHRTITVGHDPPGASQWNPIEHRLFSLIRENWAGEPLMSYETVLKQIRATRSSTGLHCRACSDRTHDATKVNVTREEQSGVRLTRHRILPKWNYTIRPQQTNTRSCRNG